MIDITSVKFAEASSSTSGIGAFNINLKSFIFQLVTFVIVLLIFKRWILPPITKTLEARRQTLEDSLTKAKEIEEALARSEEKSNEILQKARQLADQALSDANSHAKDIITKAGSAAEVQAQRIIKEAEDRLSQERQNLHEELKGELADLVVMTTEKVLRNKLNEHEDRRLVEEAVREVKV
ncbi:MAG TPA: F0F1 ATP synthase subunit B [Candidatus Saccharimonadales bacterium]|nr:F0F1 ATP synthase subunit B [Candidatus Saccharimonadales bacterium]